MNETIYAFDVGSTRVRPGPKGRLRFAWARKRPGEPIEGNDSITDLVWELKGELGRGEKVALGIESPLFIPIPKSSEHLSKGRRNEGNRSFAAPVGLAVTTLGLHQLAWILKEIFETSYANRLFTDFDKWKSSAGPALLCWEAFVSGDASVGSHLDDAATAVKGFDDEIWKQSLDSQVCVAPESNGPDCGVLSIAGTAALWSGWTTDTRILHSDCIVIKPDESGRSTARPFIARK